MKKKYYLFLLFVIIIAVGARIYIHSRSKNNKKGMELIAEGSGQSDAPKVPDSTENLGTTELSTETAESTEDYPEYDGEPYIVLDSPPTFSNLSTESYIKLGELDEHGRCTPAEACLSKDTMPPEGELRGEIGAVRPSGWKQAKYEGVVDSEPPYLYNRCHMLMWALTGLNAEERNLITGTRYMNVNMTYHELMVVNYIEDTGNHVMYRVTPVFKDDELLCRGLEMEAQSVEDDGICYHVFYFNVQPGVSIDYSTGESELEK